MKVARNLETFVNRSFVKAVLQNVTLLIRLVKKKKKNFKNIENVNIDSRPLSLLLFSQLRIICILPGYEHFFSIYQCSDLFDMV